MTTPKPKPMDARTLEALKASIAHWKRLVKIKPSNSSSEKPYASDCPLCAIFNKKGDCGECPVKLKTGQNNCGGSPWAVSEWAWVNFVDFKGPRSNWKEAATQELNFLKSLLPKT